MGTVSSMAQVIHLSKYAVAAIYPCWLMISSRIILPHTLGIIRIIIQWFFIFSMGSPMNFVELYLWNMDIIGSILSTQSLYYHLPLYPHYIRSIYADFILYNYHDGEIIGIYSYVIFEYFLILSSWCIWGDFLLIQWFPIGFPQSRAP
jgi:hypothetical protein